MPRFYFEISRQFPWLWVYVCGLIEDQSLHTLSSFFKSWTTLTHLKWDFLFLAESTWIFLILFLPFFTNVAAVRYSHQWCINQLSCKVSSVILWFLNANGWDIWGKRGNGKNLILTLLIMGRSIVLYLIGITSEISIISHCLGLGTETMSFMFLHTFDIIVNRWPVWRDLNPILLLL